MGREYCPRLCYSMIFKQPSSRFRRCQLVSLFIIFIIVCLISSFVYTFNGKRSLVDSFFLKTFLPNEIPCSHTLNESTRGPIQADTKNLPSFAELEFELGPSLLPGGHFMPHSCKSKNRVALIVPYRDRQIHLKIFLRHMHHFLQRQNLNYAIFVVEQERNTPFNRAMLLNIGFVESTKLHDYNCFVFHDVDLLPLDDRNLYSCSDEPVHLSSSIDIHDNKLMYQTLFGGASMLTGDMMKKINGYSNLYFGWGGEDDDMSYRVRSHAMMIVRYDPDVARYTMMRHAKENKEDRTRLFATSKSRIHQDGLNTLKYGLLDLQFLPLYTWVHVRINQTEILESHKDQLIPVIDVHK